MTSPDPDLARLAAASPSAWADAVSTVLHPIPVMLAGGIRLGIVGTGSVPRGIGWGVAACTFTAGIPLASFELMRRRRWVGRDRHLPQRAERLLPFSASILSYAAGCVVMARAGAPPTVLAGMLTGSTSLGAGTALTVVTKPSVHLAAFSGIGTLIVLDDARALPPLCLAAGLLAWARIRAGRHSEGQVLTGALIGGGSAVVSHHLTM